MSLPYITLQNIKLLFLYSTINNLIPLDSFFLICRVLSGGDSGGDGDRDEGANGEREEEDEEGVPPLI